MILKDTSRQLEPPPEGLYACVCVDVVDLGLQDTPWGPKPKIQITWEIDLTNAQTGRRFCAARWFGANLSEKGALRPFLEAWRGKKFSREDLAGFDPEVLVGVAGQAQITHRIRDDGRVSAQVQAMVGPAKGIPHMHPSKEFVRVKDRVTTQPDVHKVDDDDSAPF